VIHREDHDGVAVLRLEHGKANAIDPELFAELDARLDEVEVSPAVRALVLTGSGGIFSAGVNLFKVRDGGADYVATFLPRLTGSLLRLFTLPLPVVAAVNGHAIAGGLVLALACDHRVMAEGAGKLGLTELLVGVPFPTAALEIVRFQAPGRTVQDLILSGRTVTGREALAMRLVDEVAPPGELLSRSLAAAAHYGRIPRPAYALSKRQLRAPAVALIERYRAAHDAEVVAAWSAAEAREAIARYLEQTVGKK
jgi:enoyl-CoA hydratase